MLPDYDDYYNTHPFAEAESSMKSRRRIFMLDDGRSSV